MKKVCLFCKNILTNGSIWNIFLLSSFDRGAAFISSGGNSGRGPAFAKGNAAETVCHPEGRAVGPMQNMYRTVTVRGALSHIYLFPVMCGRGSRSHFFFFGGMNNVKA